MAKLRTAMDMGFGDVNVSTPATLEGTAREVPGDPFPVGIARAGGVLRPQQMCVLSRGFPLRMIPSFSPPLTRDPSLGSFALQTPLFLNPPSSNWWATFMAQFRPKKFISSMKAEITGGDELEIPGMMTTLKMLCDKTLYAIGLCSHVPLTTNSSLVVSSEAHGGQGNRSKAVYFHKFSHHDVTLEAAAPELFIDKNQTYWEMPSSVSLDMSSLISNSGLRYRVGIHKNGGSARSLGVPCDDVPESLMPGWCAKAAFSYEKNRDLWRERENPEDLLEKARKEKFMKFPYDSQLNEPHSAISGIIGGTCAAWFGGNGKPSVPSAAPTDNSTACLDRPRRAPFSADLFGSLRYTLQRGKFIEDFNDLTRLDARLDICSGAALAKGAIHLFSGMLRKPAESRKVNPLASPKLNLIFQQQVAGPIVFRVDSRISPRSPSGKCLPHVEDVVYSLCYSLKLLESGKVVFWYSPKRKEGMVELRLFEFDSLCAEPEYESD